MIKLLGTAMIVLGSGSAGFGFARAVRAQLRQLNALLAALEAMKGEIEYRLTPLPELFAALGEGTEPVTAAFFRGCAAMMEADRALPPAGCHRLPGPALRKGSDGGDAGN